VTANKLVIFFGFFFVTYLPPKGGLGWGTGAQR
jgi:hypothetical protein